jgi:trk system potassium uptake protein TrkH
VGAFFLVCIPISFIYHDHQTYAFLQSAAIAFMVGIAIFLLTFKSRNTDPNKRDSFMIVSLAWLILSLFGALPYYISGAIPSIIDALFESASGFTTTGSSILNDIEALPKSMLFWRALTHWLGGMGIIMLMVAIFPFFKVGGTHLMTAEGSLFGVDKIKPRIINVAKRLWLIYMTLTFSETVLLKIAGMTWFNAVCHSFATIATGGFSTQNASLINDSALVQYIVIAFMFLSGVNFALHYYGFKLNFREIWINEEFRLYTFLTILISAAIAISLFISGDRSFFTAIRESTFQVVSIITCTGFASADYEYWPVFAKCVLFLTMFLGACTGSTGGGIKIARFVLLYKSLVLVFKKLMYRNTVSIITMNDKTIEERFLLSTFTFVVIYILTITLGTIILTSSGVDITTAGSSVVTTLGGIGPGFGMVGPVENFSTLSIFAKLYLSFNMILGRLEILPFLYIIYIPFSKY